MPIGSVAEQYAHHAAGDVYTREWGWLKADQVGHSPSGQLVRNTPEQMPEQQLDPFEDGLPKEDGVGGPNAVYDARTAAGTASALGNIGKGLAVATGAGVAMAAMAVSNEIARGMSTEQPHIPYMPPTIPGQSPAPPGTTPNLGTTTTIGSDASEDVLLPNPLIYIKAYGMPSRRRVKRRNKNKLRL